jgi:tRNA (mo5U34)-methyltransferase
MPVFLKYVDSFSGKSVLELGCNAGLYGYEISKVAKSYVGVELESHYARQALETQRILKVKNAKFLHHSAGEYLMGEIDHFDALFATFVLYYMTNEEVKLIEDRVLRDCYVVLIMTRTLRNVPWERYNNKHFEEPKNVSRWLEKNGFMTRTKRYRKPNGKYYYAAIFGERR